MPASTTPDSMRTPGPAGQRRRVMAPVEGARERAGSSQVMRSSTLWPRGAGISPRRPPTAMRSWISTRSTPVTSSLTQCSTCRRGLTSRNHRSPSGVRRNSQVATPT